MEDPDDFISLVMQACFNRDGYHPLYRHPPPDETD